MIDTESIATAADVMIPAHERLKSSLVPGLRGLRVEESDNEIIISGTVTSYYLKQLAQEALMPLLGSRRLCNRVDVDSRQRVHSTEVWVLPPATTE